MACTVGCCGGHGRNLGGGSGVINALSGWGSPVAVGANRTEDAWVWSGGLWDRSVVVLFGKMWSGNRKRAWGVLTFFPALTGSHSDGQKVFRRAGVGFCENSDGTCVPIRAYSIVFGSGRNQYRNL